MPIGAKLGRMRYVLGGNEKRLQATCLHGPCEYFPIILLQAPAG